MLGFTTLLLTAISIALLLSVFRNYRLANQMKLKASIDELKFKLALIESKAVKTRPGSHLDVNLKFLLTVMEDESLVKQLDLKATNRYQHNTTDIDLLTTELWNGLRLRYPSTRYNNKDLKQAYNALSYAAKLCYLISHENENLPDEHELIHYLIVLNRVGDQGFMESLNTPLEFEPLAIAPDFANRAPDTGATTKHVIAQRAKAA